MTGIVFTPAEAAALTGLTVKSVNKAIENGLVPTTLRRSGAIRKRYISHTGLICLELEARGLAELPLQVRRRVFQEIARSPRTMAVRPSDAILVDVKVARQRLAAALSDLEKSKRLVVRDPEILQGTPVVRGTRIPVYLIVDMLAAGTGVEEILAGYPSLTKETVRLAELYARAFPKRGRPPKKINRRGAVRTRRPLHAVP